MQLSGSTRWNLPVQVLPGCVLSSVWEVRACWRPWLAQKLTERQVRGLQMAALLQSSTSCNKS